MLDPNSQHHLDTVTDEMGLVSSALIELVEDECSSVNRAQQHLIETLPHSDIPHVEAISASSEPSSECSCVGRSTSALFCSVVRAVRVVDTIHKLEDVLGVLHNVCGLLRTTTLWNRAEGVQERGSGSRKRHEMCAPSVNRQLCFDMEQLSVAKRQKSG